MKQKILIDCKALSLYQSGIPGYFKPLLKFVISHLIQYEFVLVGPSEFDTSFIDEYKNWTLHVVPYKKTGFKKLDLVLYDFWVLPQALKKMKGDLLISPYYDFIIPRIYKNKSIITVHDLCYWELKRFYPCIFRLYFVFLLNLNLSKAKKIITVSQSSLHKIKEIFGEKIYKKSEVIYNTFEGNATKFVKRPILENKKKTLLYTGGLEPRKNIKSLFNALQEINRRDSVTLLFTGDFLKYKILDELIQEYSLEGIVILTGVVTQSELADFYLKCDAVINLSLCEGFGRSNLEAIVYDKPLVCSDIPVFRELVGDYGIYCNPLDIEDIKRAIYQSFENQLVHENNVDMDKFSLDYNGKKFVKVIESVLQ